MKRRYFGTDGMRGRVGKFPIVPDLVLKLGFAAGQVLAHANAHHGQPPHVIIGKDTRISGYMLESALEAGLSAAGVDVLLVGPMPTPAVAYLTRALRLQAGIMISASHNPFDDNGIKFFSAQGTKLPDTLEQAMEQLLDQPLECRPSVQLGRVRRMDDATGRYIEFCKSTFPGRMDLKGLKLVVDCAHGASYHSAPAVFHELGAEVTAMGNTPNGTNINEQCGATHLAALQERVRAGGADLGIALDGDGDRLMMVDARGRIHDGDRLLYAIVKHQHQNCTLQGGVVGTVMTNLAVEQCFARMGIPFVRSAVGDRYVLEALEKRHWEWGGENSGHIICRAKHTTGDGIISALQVLAALVENQVPLDQFTADLTLYPQVLINVRTSQPLPWAEHPPIQQALSAAQGDLGTRGRVLLRASGTEALIRVMVEGEDSSQVQHWAETIATEVRRCAQASGTV